LRAVCPQQKLHVGGTGVWLDNILKLVDSAYLHFMSYGGITWRSKTKIVYHPKEN
jgi:hypothetical protein